MDNKEKYFNAAAQIFPQLTSDVILLVEKTGNIIFVNQKGLDWLEIKKDEIVGHNFKDLDIMTPSSKVKAIKNLLLRFAGKEIEPYMLTFISKSGKKLQATVNAKLLKDEKGKTIADLILITDITDVEELAKKLEKERHDFEEYLDVVATIIVALYPNGAIKLINRRGLEVLGYENEMDVIGKNWFDTFLPEENREQVKEVFKKWIEDKAGDEYFENYVVTKDGEMKLVSWRNSVITDEDGNVEVTISSGRDITHERQVELELAHSKKRLESIIESAMDAIITLDEQGKIILWNKGAERKLGWSEEEVLGRSIMDISPEKLKNKYMEDFQKLTSGKASTPLESVEAIAQKKDGTKFPTEVTIGSWSEGEKSFFNIVMRDITERKKALELLEKEQEIIKEKVEERTKDLKKAQRRLADSLISLHVETTKLQVSVDSLPLGFFILDPSHEVQIINEIMVDTFGLEKNSTTLEDIIEALGSDRLNKKALCVHCRSDSEGYESYEIEELDANESIYRIFSHPVLENDKLIGTAVLVEDITEEKTLERRKDEFFSIASHELRTPLTAIRGNVSLIEQYFGDILEDKPVVKEMLSDIGSSSIRLIRMVNDFLDASRIEQERLQMSVDKVDLKQITKQVIKELKTLAERQGLSLELEIMQDLPAGWGDKERVEQIITNLISNAIKYTPEGGIKVSLVSRDGFIEVKVEDTGIGIAEEDQALLFQKFQQAEHGGAKTRTVAKGTGMGLYISKLLAEKMNGTIYLAKTKIGEGSTFVFTLPTKSSVKKE